MFEGGIDDVGLNHHVLVNEFSRISFVGMNAAHPCGRQEYVLRFFLREEAIHCLLVGQVQRFTGAGNDVGIGFRFKKAE